MFEYLKYRIPTLKEINTEVKVFEKQEIPPKQTIAVFLTQSLLQYCMKCNGFILGKRSDIQVHKS